MYDRCWRLGCSKWTWVVFICCTIYIILILLQRHIYDSREPQAHKKDWLEQEFASRAAQVKAGCAAHPPPLSPPQQHAHDTSTTLTEPVQKLDLLNLSKHLLYFPHYNLTWCSVPKVASTAWSKALLDVEDIPIVESKTYQSILLHNFRLKDPSHAGQVVSESLKFLFVRHPFQRLVSAYRNKLENSSLYSDGEAYYRKQGRVIVEKYRKRGRTVNSDRFPLIIENEDEEGIDYRNFYNRSSANIENSLEKNLVRETGDAQPRQKGIEDKQVLEQETRDENYEREPTFREYVDYLIDTNIYDYDKHWQPISLLCRVCDYDFNYIIKYENFQEEINYFIQLLKENNMLPSNFQLKWENRGNTDQQTTDKYLELVGERKLWQLYDKYLLDFINFGYTVDDYVNH